MKKQELIAQEQIENLSEEERNVIHGRLLRKANNVVRAIFGEIDGEQFTHWWDFQCFLLAADTIDHLRTDKDFKWGLQMVAFTTSGVQKIHQSEEQRAEDYQQLADTFISEPARGQSDDHRAMLKLIECFEILKVDGRRWGFHQEDLIDFELDLEIIERCQRMALKAAKIRGLS